MTLEINDDYQTKVESEDAPASPFLPNTFIQYAWDSTSLGYLKQCPRLYQYIMIEGWVGKDENVHLRFGQEYHSALEEYDRLRVDEVPHNDAVRDVISALLTRTFGWEPDRDTKAGKYKNRDSLVRTVIYYLDAHKDDAAKVHILKDGSPAVELSFRFELEFGPRAGQEVIKSIDQDATAQPYLLCGHLDKVVEFSGALFNMDHKTTTITPGQYFFDQFSPNNQMTLYTLASQIILDAPIRGVIINAAQLLIDDSRFQRGFTYRTPDQLTEWVNDLRYWLSLAEEFATHNYWPMNDTACDKYGGCRFRGICSKSPSVRERFLEGNFTKLPLEERWNPLKPR